MNNLTLQEQLKALSPELFVNTKEERCENKFENKINNNILTKDKIHSNNFKPREVITMNKINNTKDLRRPQRRELWYVNLGNPQGSLQKGIRPCLVDSNDVNNKYSNIVNVYPLTSQMTKAKIPVHIEIQGYGLKEKSIILIEQGVPIDIRIQLIDYIGIVDDLVMKKVDKAREIQHGDLKPKLLLEKLPLEMKNYIIKSFKMIETYDITIETMKSNDVQESAISLIEDQKFREENGLKTYCYNNNIFYDTMYNDYKEIIREKEESIAL